MSTVGALIALVVRRELALSWRKRSVTLGCLLFFCIATSLFPLALGPDPLLLRTIAPGVLWMSALFAAMLAAGHLFMQDFSSGALEQMLLSPHSLPLIVFGKILAHWLSSGFALVVLTPLVALQYGLDWHSTGLLMASLLLGTPLLSLIGAMGAALTLGVRSGGAMLGLLLLPLYVPVLIFGAAAADPVRNAAWSQANFSLLGAALCAAIWLCPWATAAALRIAME
ncbi:heme exporter protein CcmB [Paraburkholderia bonniea]|uniref:heme exporter protein CcmB n=1 Tax=Paraburkholderia bonniea TaxID=2152891 RepID=UPI001290EC3D|nr:heme exporter protein CcmB [Paraburkholderia bonniea]WJF91954.1 heme exporter protein CcmB [Paraburkholderia bonniea]WJF95273.1 heme exporter protein CcmB [Paraburkholderia bonniea]